MSFHLKYSPLFRVAFREDGNPSKWLDDIKMVPSASCQRLLQQYHLMAKPRAYGVEVYFRSNLNFPVGQQILNEIVRSDFSFLIIDRKIPSGYSISSELNLKHFRVDNLDGTSVLGHDSKLTSGPNLSENDKFDLLPDSPLYKLRPFGIISITWDGMQSARIEDGEEHFRDYWIDLVKLESNIQL